jgi:LmbE family N-acetylglucosaminyl deacetylase
LKRIVTFPRLTLAFAIAIAVSLASPGASREIGSDSAAALHEKLLKLQTAASLLHVTAHPDDEHGGMLALLSRGRGVRVVLASLTRGEAGANAIGPELFDSLGSVRAEELAQAGRFYGLDALYFTRLADYGYSKRLSEAISKWGKEDALRDLVFLIRKERPLVVVSRFQGNDRDGHGQHQFAGLMAREAFRAAGDPSAFAELAAAGVAPWKPLKLYMGGAREDERWNLSVDSGEYDPWFGETFENEAREGLRLQRSQNGGDVDRVEGPFRRYYVRLESLVDAPERETSFFDGIDTTLAGVARLETPALSPSLESELMSIEDAARSALESLDPSRPETAVPALLRGIESLRRLREKDAGNALSHLLERKDGQFEEALRAALGLRISALAEPAGPVVPGEDFQARLTLTNRGVLPVRARSVKLLVPEGWTVRGPTPESDSDSELKRGESWSKAYSVRIPPSASVLEPQVDRASIAENRYRSDGAWFQGAPPPAATAEVVYEVNGVTASASEAVAWRESRLPYGLMPRELVVLPPVSVAVAPRVAIVPLDSSSRGFDVVVEITTHDPAGVRGRVALELPEGLVAEPASYDLVSSRASESMRYPFHVGARPIGRGTVELRASVAIGDRIYRRGYEPLEHRDLPTRYRITTARTRVVGVDVTLPRDLLVGYVMGVGDEVPDAIRALGAKVDLLTAEDLASRDLSSYDAVVLGTRAYAVREDLVTHNQRLLDFVEAGGHLVVLYNTPELHPRGLAPYPAELPENAEEVSEEDAPVEFLAPDHPLLNWPNRIGPGDFDSWVEQRGSKFWSEWDDRYVPLVSSHDQEQAPQKGGWLTARYGKGYYTYFAYALHRQLPSGVPGAYRILANLISLRRQPAR